MILLWRDREAPDHGGGHRRAPHRPEGRRGHRGRRGAPFTGRGLRPRPSHRLLPLPGPHGRGQDRAGQGPGRVPLR